MVRQILLTAGAFGSVALLAGVVTSLIYWGALMCTGWRRAVILLAALVILCLGAATLSVLTLGG